MKALVERQFELERRRRTASSRRWSRRSPCCGPTNRWRPTRSSDALAEARRLAIAAAMHAVAGKIRDNGLGLAPADHQEILQDLQIVLDILANNRSQENQRLLRELGEARQLSWRAKEAARGPPPQDRRSGRSRTQVGAACRRAKKPGSKRQPKSRRTSVRRRCKWPAAWSGCSPTKRARSATKAAEKMDQTGHDATTGDAAGASRHATRGRTAPGRHRQTAPQQATRTPGTTGIRAAGPSGRRHQASPSSRRTNRSDDQGVCRPGTLRPLEPRPGLFGSAGACPSASAAARGSGAACRNRSTQPTHFAWGCRQRRMKCAGPRPRFRTSRPDRPCSRPSARQSPGSRSLLAALQPENNDNRPQDGNQGGGGKATQVRGPPRRRRALPCWPN